MRVEVPHHFVVSPAFVEKAGSNAFLLHQSRHGDWDAGPDWAERFESMEELHAWARTQEPTRPPADDSGVEPWVQVASYARHPLAPYNEGAAFEFEVFGRIDADGLLELAAVPKEDVFADKKQEGSRPFVLARVALDDLARSCGHGDTRARLRLADAAVSREVLLQGEHLRMSAAPRCIGVFMESGRAFYRQVVREVRVVKTSKGEEVSREELEPVSRVRSLEHYGFIWVYYAAILDDVLYVVSIPAFSDPAGGSVVVDSAVERTFEADGTLTERLTTARVSLPCPPTEDDLRASGFPGVIYNPNDVVDEGGLQSFAVPARRIFGTASDGKLGRHYDVDALTRDLLVDDEEGSVLCRRVLARVDKRPGRGFAVTPLMHGDVDAGLTFTSARGGVYADVDGGLQWTPAAELEFAALEKEEVASFLQAGASLYIPYRSAGAGGWMYAGWLSWEGTRQGPVYSLQGPLQAWGSGLAVEQRDVESLVLAEVTCSVTTTTISDDAVPPVPPPIGPSPEPDPTAEDDFEELPRGRLGDFYEYTCDSSAVAPLHMSSSLGDDDLAGLIESAGPDAARQVLFSFALNRGSRLFKTPSFQYTVTVTLGGSDGPYSWMGEAGKFCNVGSATLEPPRLGSGEFVAALTVAWAAPHDEVAPDKEVTLVKTVPAKDKSGACRLAGATSVTASERLSAGSLIRVEESATQAARYPARFYEVTWTEVWDEEKADPDSGELVRDTHKTNYRRFLRSRDDADALTASLPTHERAEVTRGPRTRSLQNPAWWVVHVMHVSVDQAALRRAMCWEREFTAAMSGELTLSATSGSYYIAASVGEVVKALPS